MNYFAHGRDFLHDPYFVAGTAVPDWLNVVDRKMRVSSKAAAQFIHDENQALATVARGIVQHHADDRWFHQTPTFLELNRSFSSRIRELMPGEDWLRASFLGHILVEILLDAVLIDDDPPRLEAYYRVFDALDGRLVEECVNRMANHGSQRLAWFIERFREERFLCDYADDAKLLGRLNMVMRRVKLPPLADAFLPFFPEARRTVRERKYDLLNQQR